MIFRAKPTASRCCRHPEQYLSGDETGESRQLQPRGAVLNVSCREIWEMQEVILLNGKLWEGNLTLRPATAQQELGGALRCRWLHVHIGLQQQNYGAGR